MTHQRANLRCSTHPGPEPCMPSDISLETTVELESKHNAVDRHRLLDLRPDLPRALVAAIERALAVDPTRRFASLGAMAESLTDAAHGQMKSPGRKRLRWAGAAGLLLAAGALLWAPPSPHAPGNVVWLRASAGGDVVLQPGTEVLLGDALALDLTLDQTRHVYVINEDSHGERFQLFPLAESDLANPLPPGRTRLPGTDASEPVDWRITSRGGRERFYVLIADEPLADLKRLALNQATMAQGDSAVLVAANDPVRGVGGLSPRQTPSGAADAEWLAGLRERYPALRIERFELANP